MDNNNVYEEEGLSIKDILIIIRKHLIAIIAFVVVFTAGGFVYSRVQTPEYKATTTMLCMYDSNSTTLNTGDYTLSNYISSTFVGFIKENVVLESAADKLVADGTYTGTTAAVAKTLTSNLTVSNSSLIITVSYVSNDPVKAQTIVNTIAETAVEVSNSTNADGTVKYHLLNGNLSVLSVANPGTKVSKTMKDLLIGFAAGVVLAFIYVFLRELLDTSFKSTEDIEKTLGLPVIAGIPEYNFDEEKEAK